MFSLMNLKIGQRLALMMGALLALMAALAFTGWWGVNALHRETVRVLKQDLRLAQEAAEIQRLVLLARRFEKDSFINLDDASKLPSYAAKWTDARTQLGRAIERTAPLAQEVDDREAITQLGQHLEVYAGGFQATLAAIGSGQLKTAAAANGELGKVKTAVHGMDTIADAMGERALKRAGRVEASLTEVRSRATNLQSTLAGLGFVAAVGLSWLVTRSITRPLGTAVAVAQRVAEGDLSNELQAEGRDETAQLLGALGRMTTSLRRIVGQVRAGSDSIATGSTQIASGNADLSQRTEEQASNLQQTAASMEQLTATVKQNAEAAREASRLAGTAAQVATTGGATVERVVATMQEISTASRRIADIIGVIDGIAFQTNILALNAAVEAARAGETGRGFAVVASEVRGLAQRSAQAARQIKALIVESVERVEAGGRIVSEAGRTMDEIVTQVRRVAELIAEIGSSSAQQSTGIDQIGDAVTQLDQVTQQNAALVEESAAAAESLKHQALKLAEVVALFRLDTEAGHGAAPLPGPSPVSARTPVTQPAEDASWTPA